MKTELVTTLKRHATRVLAELRDSGEPILITEHGKPSPILITEHGKPSAYLVDVDSYEFMRRRMQILEGISRGERAIIEDRTFSQAEARKKMKKWLD
ncbi:MAG: type II toxin-antitoxin system Phd/YefM family antitoxin [Deltaproteobacteria bacterium]|nr:type II toxin-antitoxin system Phd/YefM family antitoxin [Deltaproteobacteria bacterium]